MKHISHLPALALLTLAGLVSGSFTPAALAGDVVKLTREDGNGKIRVEIGGKLFTEYIYKGAAFPYFYPVIGPSGHTVTRHFPMKKGVAGESPDHPHHRSLWFTHGSVEGQDYWNVKPGKDAGPVIENAGIKKAESGDGQATIVAENVWKNKEGKVVQTDTTTYTITALENGERYIDVQLDLHAKEGDVLWGDTKEGSMAIRLAPTMRYKGKVGKGHIVNSNGQKDGNTWGKRAKWCDYYGPDESGAEVGVAIFDHPENLRHPTWWHVRDYGLFAANPFGIHNFERKAGTPGDHTVKKGETMTQKYRFYFHHGDTKKAKVGDHYDKYTAGN